MTLRNSPRPSLRHGAWLAVLPLMLAGCGGGDSQSEDAATPEPAVEEVAAPADVVPTTEPVAEEAAAEETAAVAQPPAVFAQCRSCHSVEPGKQMVGPSLAGVFGHKAGEVAGYNFSAAMKNSGMTLDEATLDKYLEAPQKVVPGTKMAYAGMKDAAKRKELIEYLKTI